MTDERSPPNVCLKLSSKYIVFAIERVYVSPSSLSKDRLVFVIHCGGVSGHAQNLRRVNTNTSYNTIPLSLRPIDRVGGYFRRARRNDRHSPTLD